MKLSERYLTTKDIALSNFARALALPVRICIIRFILENGNEVTREALHQKIPFNKETINLHINDLKNLTILSATNRDKTLFYKVDEDMFISMSNTFLNLFESIGYLNQKAKDMISRPKLKRRKTDMGNNTEEPITAQSFGKFMQERRRAIGLSQLELSSKFQLDRGYLSKIESGKKTFKSDNLKLLAEILVVPLPELIKLYYQDKINNLNTENQHMLAEYLI